jgi:trk system potassium uptake protein TrkA
VNIVIVGAGTVGVSLAKYLIKQHHFVSIIERDQALCNDINTKMDVFVVTGSGTRPSVLESAGIRNADMLIAVTPSDDTNLVLCNFARQYGVDKCIARIKSSEYFSPDSPVKLTELGVTHLIETEKEVVKNIMQYIEFPQATQTANFHSDSVYLRGFKVIENMQLANKTLIEIKQFTSVSPLLVVAIIRGNDTVLPTGDTKLLPGDEVIAMMPKESFKNFRKLVSSPDEKVSRVIVYGDSLTAIHLAQDLKNLAETINFIDPDIDHAKKAASVLKGLDVITGNCTNVDIFQEIRVQNADFFISVVEDDDDNIMSCLLAKAEGARKVIAVRNDQRHVDLFLSLGVDHIINPQNISTQKIIEDIKEVPIENHLKLKNGGIEVMRFKAGRNSRIIKKPLRDLQGLFKRSIIVGIILRDNDVFIPGGDTLINEGDEVFVLFNSENTQFVHKLFKSSMI